MLNLSGLLKFYPPEQSPLHHLHQCNKLNVVKKSKMQPCLKPKSQVASTCQTNACIQGKNLKAPVNCSFSKGSTSIEVIAKTVNSTMAVCVAPSWPVSNETAGLGSAGSREAIQVTLSVVSGGCAIQRPFEYYNEPEILGVFPRRGPRYGSFQLTVDLGGSLDFATMDWVSAGSLPQPLVCICSPLHLLKLG